MTTRLQRKVARRHFLRGAGGIAVGLPYLLGREGYSHAQGGEPPERLLTGFFGNGMPAALSANGYTGVMKSLAPLASKLTMIRGINTTAQAGGPGNDAGCHAFCCALTSDDNTNKQGPSLDWVALEHHKPTSPHQTISAGVFSAKQGGKRCRWLHSWRGKAQPNDTDTNPAVLFQKLFGGGVPTQGDPAAMALAEQRRLQRKSVLDAVITEYESVISPASGYPSTARALMDDHLSLLRELEKRVQAVDPAMLNACNIPTAPQSADAQKDFTYQNAFDLWSMLFPIISDIYVAGLRCDLFRYGNVLVTNGGDEYSRVINGKEAEDIRGDWFHRYEANKAEVDSVIEWTWSMLAQHLAKMDDPNFLEANGKTILENSTMFMGTELGTLPNGHDNLTFVIGGRTDRFAGGIHEFNGESDVDMYQTILASMGVTTPFGEQEYRKANLSFLK